jgi:hypothetical protein
MPDAPATTRDYSLMAHRAAAIRQRRKAALQRIVRAYRLVHALPADLHENDVLERLARALEAGSQLESSMPRDAA